MRDCPVTIQSGRYWKSTTQSRLHDGDRTTASFQQKKKDKNKLPWKTFFKTQRFALFLKCVNSAWNERGKVLRKRAKLAEAPCYWTNKVRPWAVCWSVWYRRHCERCACGLLRCDASDCPVLCWSARWNCDWLCSSCCLLAQLVVASVTRWPAVWIRAAARWNLRRSSSESAANATPALSSNPAEFPAENRKQKRNLATLRTFTLKCFLIHLFSNGSVSRKLGYFKSLLK